MDFNAILSAALGAAIEQALQPLQARINELEQQARIERGVGIALAERIDAFTSAPATLAPLDKLLLVPAGAGDPELSDWFRSVVEAIVETALEEHNSDYDHDEFQTSDQVEDAVQDKFSDGLESAVRDLLEHATLSIR